PPPRARPAGRRSRPAGRLPLRARPAVGPPQPPRRLRRLAGAGAAPALAGALRLPAPHRREPAPLRRRGFQRPHRRRRVLGSDALPDERRGAAYFQRKSLRATRKQATPQPPRMAIWGKTCATPCPSFITARSAWLRAVSGRALIAGCTASGKRSEEKKVPE